MSGFSPSVRSFPGQSARAGAPFKIGAGQTDAAVEITTPSGKKEMLASGGSLVFADTLEAGFYAFKDRQREGQFAVNLLDEAESQIVSAIEPQCVDGKNRHSGVG